MTMNRFETVLADTAAAEDIHFNLRYQVFCEEAGFEDPKRFPDARERDEYDRDAVHFIVWDRLMQRWAGAMRLVSAATREMPCEAIAGRRMIDDRAARARAVEFSRLCIPARCRHTDSGSQIGRWVPYGGSSDQGRTVFFRQRDNEILQRLLRASFAWGMSQGVEHCYFIINRALTRLLKRFGIPLQVMGDAVEHRGARTPHRYHVEAAHAGMMAESADYADMADTSPGYMMFSELQRESRETVATDAIVYPFPSEHFADRNRRYAAAPQRGGQQDLAVRVA